MTSLCREGLIYMKQRSSITRFFFYLFLYSILCLNFPYTVPRHLLLILFFFHSHHFCIFLTTISFKISFTLHLLYSFFFPPLLIISLRTVDFRLGYFTQDLNFSKYGTRGAGNLGKRRIGPTHGGNQGGDVFWMGTKLLGAWFEGVYIPKF